MKKVLSIVLTLALLLSVLPMALGVTASAAEATGTGDYAIYFDNSSNGNNFWVTKRNDDHPEIGMEELNLPAGNTYTVEFDVYALTAGSNVVFGATKSTWDTTAAIEGGHQVWKNAPATVEEWTHYSFNVKTTETWNGVIFYVTGDGFKGYIDNLTIKDSTGKVAASFEPTADDLSKTSNCGSIVELTAELAYAKNYDYGIYIDNSANTIQSNAIWSNVLGMPKLNLEPGKTYTLKFDNYALNASTGGHCYVGVNSTGGGITGQNWWNTKDVVGEWATQSVNFTFTGANLAYHTLHVGAGFKGYMDNFRVYDGDTEVARWEIDKSSLGKENSGASVVLLPQEISEVKNIAYKIEIDAEGKLFRTAYDGSLGAGASIKFDYYLVSGKVKVDGTNDSGAYLNKGVGSFELSVPVSKSFTITSRSAEFVELYIWNVEITQAGTPLQFKSYEGRTNCDWEKIPLSKVPEYVEKDYGMLVDTTSVAADGSANKSFWFNELGMDSYYNTLVAGETYTFAFDVYPLTKTENINLFHFRTSSGSADVWGGFWKGNNLVANKWNTTSTTFTVDDASKTGNHILFVFGGFKGYVDNVRIIDKDGNVVSKASTDFNSLTVPEKHNAYLTIDVLSDELVAAKDPCIHTYNAVTTDSTCTEAGAKTYTCTLCGDVVTEVIGSAAGHVDADSNNVCDVCNDGDFAILIDNSQGTGYGQLYLHEVGMPSLSMPAGDYIVEFDFYPLNVGDTNFPIQITNTGWTADAVTQAWINTPDTTGKWIKVTKEVKATETGAYPWFYVGAGIKGYMDNFKVIDKATGDVILNFEGVYEDLGKTSKTINTMVALDATLKAAKAKCVHTYNVNVSYPNCEEDGVKNYVCSICGDFYEVIYATATGHTYDNDFDADCNVCGDIREVAHQCVAGDWEVVTEATVDADGLKVKKCSCGKVMEEKVIPRVLNFRNKTLALQSNISIIFRVDPVYFTKHGYSNPVVTFNFLGVDYPVTEYTVNASGLYEYAFNVVAPHQMKEMVYATFSAEYEGEVYTSAAQEYSIYTYCNNQITKNSANPAYAKVMALLVDILNYGAAAQNYQGYKTDNLANAELTAAQKALGNQDVITYTDEKQLKNEIPANGIADIKVVGLTLQDSVVMNFKFELLNGATKDGLVAVITAAGKTWEIEATDFTYESSSKRWIINFNGLNPAQMREKVSICLKKDGVIVSDTATYSVESYGLSTAAQGSAKLAALVEAMARYGRSAKAYNG